MDRAIEALEQETDIIKMIRKIRLYMETLKLIIGLDTMKEIQEKVEKIKVHEAFSVTTTHNDDDDRELERQVKSQVVLQDIATNLGSESSIQTIKLQSQDQPRLEDSTEQQMEISQSQTDANIQLPMIETSTHRMKMPFNIVD